MVLSAKRIRSAGRRHPPIDADADAGVDVQQMLFARRTARAMFAAGVRRLTGGDAGSEISGSTRMNYRCLPGQGIPLPMQARNRSVTACSNWSPVPWPASVDGLETVEVQEQDADNLPAVSAEMAD